MAWWTAFAGQGAAQMGKLDDALTGMALGQYGDRRQYFQQKKLQGLAIRGQKELADYEAMHNYNMWEKTGPVGMREQLEKAGLNVGLMLAQGGAGGTTHGASVGNVSTAMAESGSKEILAMMDIGQRARMQAAQTQAIEAQTEKTKAETEKLTGVDTTKTENEIEKLIAETTSEQLKQDLTKYQTEIAKAEASIKSQTVDELVNQIYIAGQKLEGEAQQQLVKGQIEANTGDDVIKQIKQNTIEQQMRIAAMKQGIEVDKQTIKHMAREMQQMTDNFRAEWRNWEQREKERWVKEKLATLAERETDFNTGGLAQTKQIADILTTILHAVPKGGGGGKK